MRTRHRPDVPAQASHRSVVRRAFRAVALLAAGCAVTAAGGQRAQAEPSLPVATAGQSTAPVVKLKIGEIGEPIALIAAIDRGYFAQQNLDVELVPLSGGPALISATIGGSTDLNYGDIFSWVAALANGFKIELIQPSNGGDAPSAAPGGNYTLLVNASSGIKTAANLKGKQIGTAPTQLMQLEAKLWLRHNGVDPAAVQLVPVTPYLSMGAALAGKHVDAVLDADPYTQQSEKQYGFTAIGVPSQEVPKGATVAGYYATTAWLKGHEDVAKRFVIAYRQAASWANQASAEEKAALWAKYSPVDLEALQAEIPGIVKSFHYALYQGGPIDIAATQQWIDLAVEYGVLDKSVPIRDHIHPTATAPTLP